MDRIVIPNYNARISGFRDDVFKEFTSSTRAVKVENDNLLDTTKNTFDEMLLEQLNSNNDVDQRYIAILEITENINDSYKDAIPVIWFSVSDLLVQKDINKNIRRSVIQLLEKCIKFSNTSDKLLKLMFYFTVIENCCKRNEQDQIIALDYDMDLFLGCLVILTSNGSKTSLFEKQYVPSLNHFLNTLSKVIIQSTPKTIICYISLLKNYLHYDNNLFLSEDTIVDILNISSTTSDPNVLSHCLYLLDTCVIKDLITNNNLFELMKILTGSFVLSGKLNHQVVFILLNLTKTSYWDSCLNYLLELVHTDFNFRLRIGSMRILTELISNEDFKNIDMSHVSLNELLIKFIDFSSEFNKELLQICNILLSTNRYMISCKYDSNMAHHKTNSLNLLTILSQILLDVETRKNNFKRVESIYFDLINIINDDKIQYYGFNSASEILHFILMYQDCLTTELEKMIIGVLSNTSELILPLNLKLQFTTQLLQTSNSAYTKGKSLDLLSILIKRFNDLSEILEPCKTIFCELRVEKDNNIIIAYEDLLYNIFIHASLNELNLLYEEYIKPEFELVSSRKKSFVLLNNIHNTKSYLGQLTLEVLTKSLIKLFFWSSCNSSEKCVYLYKVLIFTFNLSMDIDNTELLLIIGRALSRIRCDGSGCFYLDDPYDLEGVSSALKRNGRIDPIKSKYLWSYPETFDYIPQEYLGIVNVEIRFSHDNKDSTPGYFIDIGLWISLIIKLLGSSSNWEIYSFLICHICSQTSSTNLLKGHYDLVYKLVDIYCNKLSDSSQIYIKLPKCLYKGDLYIVYVRNLSSLLVYHRYLPRQISEQVVNVLLFGLKFWEKTIVPILHILTVCCYEIPIAVKKYLTPILAQLSTKITTTIAIPMILEFILALSDSPDIISHLTMDEFKRVFAIAFKLVQSSRDLQDKAQRENLTHLSSHEETICEKAPSTVFFPVTSPVAHFYLTLSYQVISNWFLRMKMTQRQKIAPFVIKGLINSATDDKLLDHDTLAYLDLVTRFTFTNADLRVETVPIDNPHKDNPSYKCQRWIYGDSVITIETNIQTGNSLITTRKCTGTSVFQTQLMSPPTPQTYNLFNDEHEDDISDGEGVHSKLELDEVRYSQEIMFSPNHFFLQLCYRPLQNIVHHPILIPSVDESISRSIDMFDRIPIVEFHKIGLLYLCPGQKNEIDVLSNTSGSYQYNWFLKQLGNFVKLDEAYNYYIGGLQFAVDGEYGLVWNDRKSQVIFHVVTLMPNTQGDTQFTLKKRHVGNDLVNIFYDESGNMNFDFNLLKSQFNFINIVIQPCEISRNKISQFYKVKIYRKSGVPGILSTSHFKLLNKERLVNYVRHVSLIADTFSTCWYQMSSNEYCTNWATRSRQIELIRQKTIRQQNISTNQTNDTNITMAHETYEFSSFT